MKAPWDAWTFLGLSVFTFVSVFYVTMTAEVSFLARLGLGLSCITHGFLVWFSHQKLTEPPAGDDDEDQGQSSEEDPGEETLLH